MNRIAGIKTDKRIKMNIPKSSYPNNPISNPHTTRPLWSGIIGVPLLFLYLVVAYGQSLGQGDYTLNGHMPKGLGKNVSLTVYDGDSSCRRLSKRVKDGKFVFAGHIRKPCVAELSFSGGRSLYLYLEPAEMNVEINADDLEHSPVTGSRTNSQYRYALENSGSRKALTDYIQENRKSPIAALVLFQRMHNLENSDVEKLFRTLDSSEAYCYHYHAIKRHIAESLALAVGNPLPDFEFIDYGKTKRIYDCLRRDTMTVVFFGATWCDICKRDLATARQLCGNSVNCINIDIDADRRGWDAPFIEKLNIAHLPFIILLDEKGRILSRDVRIWELERFINEHL